MAPWETSDHDLPIYTDRLLNGRSELVIKCRYDNKFQLKNF